MYSDFDSSSFGQANKVREYVVSPVTGLAIGAMVGAASGLAARAGGVYRMGITVDDVVPWWGDFRFLGFLGALGLNLLPYASQVPGIGSMLGGVVDKLEGLPVVGMAFGETAQDVAMLLGGTALISYAATEGVGAKDTGQFMGLPLPQFVMDFLNGPDEQQPAIEGPTLVPEIEGYDDLAVA